MEVGNFWRVLLRRWQFTAAAILLVVGATYLGASREGPTYKTQGSVLLLPPDSSGSGSTSAESANPYLALGGLTQARDVVVRALSARSEAEDFGKSHPGVSYTATPDFTTGSPIVVLNVEAPEQSSSLEGLDDLTRRVPAVLDKLQVDLGISTSAYITSTVLTQDTTPAPVRKYQVRAALTYGAGMAMVCLLLIGLLDGLLLSGRLRRRTTGAVGEDEHDGTPLHDEDEPYEAYEADEPVEEYEPDPGYEHVEEHVAGHEAAQAYAPDDVPDAAADDETVQDLEDVDDKGHQDPEDPDDDATAEDVDDRREESEQVQRAIALSPVRSVGAARREDRPRNGRRGRDRVVRDDLGDDPVPLRFRDR